jgi:hypothetical protein
MSRSGYTLDVKPQARDTSANTFPDIETGASRKIGANKSARKSLGELKDYAIGKGNRKFRWGPIIYAFITAMAGMTLFGTLYGFTLIQNGTTLPVIDPTSALYATLVAAFMAAYSVFQWGSQGSTGTHDAPAKLTPGGAILTWFHGNVASSWGRIIGMLLGQFVGGFVAVLLLRTVYHISTISIIAPSVDPFHSGAINNYQAFFAETIGTATLLIVEYALDSTEHLMSTRAIILFITRLALGVFAFSSSAASFNLMFWLTFNICTNGWEPFVNNSFWVYPVSALVSFAAVIAFIMITREISALLAAEKEKKKSKPSA